MISLNAKRLSRDFFGPEGSGRGACPAASKERQKSSISQKMVTISMQNSSGMGLAAQGRFYLSHSARVLLFYFVELTLFYIRLSRCCEIGSFAVLIGNVFPYW